MRVYPEVIEHYTEGNEAGRLFRNKSRLELERTRELLARHLPPPPVRILDIGGAAGVHAFWLAEQGYEVSLIDLTPKHIEQAKAYSAEQGTMLAEIRLGDGRALPYADASFDTALLCGPLYHLPEPEDRMQALRETYRVLRPGGVLFAAILSRFASLFEHAIFGDLADGARTDYLCRIMADGRLVDPPAPERFTTAYFHRPEEARVEAAEAGFKVEHLYAIESIGRYVADHDAMADDQKFEAMLKVIRCVEQEETVLGVSTHQLLVGRK